MTRRALVALAALAAIAVAIALVAAPRGTPAPRVDAPAAPAVLAAVDEPLVSRATPNDPLVMALAAADPGEPGEPGMTEAEAKEWAREHAERSLALYRAAMVYPPWSRPVDGSTRHVIDWNRPPDAGQPFAADKDRREIRADAVLDRMYAGPGDEVAVAVRVRYVDDGAPFVPDEITATVEWNEAGAGWQPAAEVPLVRDGDAYVGRFVPSALPELAEAPREAQLLAFVRVGEFFKRLPLGFVYAAETPIVVYGVAGDRLRDGSLEVLLDVDVKHAAPTLVQAALYDAAGKEAIATFDDYLRPAQTGRQQLAMRFFGRVIRERGIDGPYRIRALHGHVKVPDAEPPEVFWSFPDEPAARTQRYRSTAFSDAEWTSAEKDDKVALYDRMIQGR